MAESKNKMSLVGLTTIVMVNMMGSGIIMLPSSMAKVGAISLLSWIVTALGSMALAWSFAQLGVFCPRSGGLSAYTEEAHGSSGYFMASFLYYISLAVANVAIAISAVGYMTSLFPWLGTGAVPLFVGVVSLIWLTTLANFGGPKVTGRIGAITVWGVIIPVAGLSIIGWYWFSTKTFIAAWNPQQAAFGTAITGSIPLTLWAFLGLESAAQNSDAVENPKRNVPLACLFGTLGAGVVYVLSTTVIQGIIPNAVLAASNAPFADVYTQIMGPVAGKIVLVLAIIACLGSLLGWQFTLSQTSKFTADAGYFPKIFSKLTAKEAPVLGMLIAGVLQTLMALSTMSPAANEQFGKLVSIACVTNIVPYITAVSALMLIMYREHLDSKKVAINTTVAVIATAYSIYALAASGIEAVFGGMMIISVGYLLYGFIAYKFEDVQPVIGKVIPKPIIPGSASQQMTMYKVMKYLIIVIICGISFFAVRESKAGTLERIQKTGTFKIGYPADQAPFASTVNNNPVGYAIEMCRTIADDIKTKLGNPTLNVQFVSSPASTATEKVKNGEFDLYCGVLAETAKDRVVISYSIPIFSGGVGALVNKNAPESLLKVLRGEIPSDGPSWRASVNGGLMDLPVVVLAGSDTENLARERLEQKKVRVKLVTVSNADEAIKMVASGKASVFFADQIQLRMALKRMGDLAVMIIPRYFTVGPYGLILARNDDDFRLIVDTALSKQMRAAGFTTFYAKHFGEAGEMVKLLSHAYSLQ